MTVTAGLRISVKSDMKEILRDVQQHPKLIRQAMISAMNRAASRASTEVRREIAKEFKVPARYAKRRISVRKAERGRLAAAIYVGVKPLWPPNLGTIKQTKAGARVGRHTFPGAFSLPAGHVSKAGKRFSHGMIAKRLGPASYPIDVQVTKIWPRAQAISQITVERVTRVEFPKRFRHEYERRLRRLG